jgi:hypothetical protein
MFSAKREETGGSIGLEGFTGSDYHIRSRYLREKSEKPKNCFLIDYRISNFMSLVNFIFVNYKLYGSFTRS